MEMDEFMLLKHDENCLVEIKQGLAAANNEDMVLKLVAYKTRCNNHRVGHGAKEV